MASALFPITLLALLLCSSTARHHKPPPSAGNPGRDTIHEACKGSGDPVTCESFLSKSIHLPLNATVSQVIQSILVVSSEDHEKAKGMVKNILDASAGNLNRSTAASTCLEVLHYSDYRINLTKDALPRGEIKDARAWAGAALAYQYDCWSALKYVNGTDLVDDAMSFLNSTVIFLSSNALSMMQNYDVYGEKTGSWGPPRTERDGFWEPVSDHSGSGFNLGVPAGLKADVTVCKFGGCTYKTVQEAVNAAPDDIDSGKLFVVHIKAGVYEETVRVGLERRNVVFLGDGMGKTVITGSMNVGQPGVSTFNSATVGVVGDGFMVSDLTIKNTAGPDAHQAVAFRSDSDHSIIQNCEFVGNQDTLYSHSLRQYYKSCRIQGNVDFIFGNSAAIFQDCLILVAPRQIHPEKGEKNAVTAHGRIHPGQTTGFVFQNCLVNGTDAYMALYHSNPKAHRNYLGRPWKEYSRTVFIRCRLESLINSDGWMPWKEDFALKTLYYGEFASSGLGSDSSKRVNWSSLIPAKHVESYSARNFIQGDQWTRAFS
ncbi:probable pectinesterase/pectinesterase inhibitor 51 [Primulina huaijiensis]|uniref:probable pectinesterase/pectinesterase inhibitor 51 n=1 Tax=Primulina huaijiensis TaxID=1492673 RepID=UPI003CC727E4